MDVLKAALVLLAGCGLDVGAAQPWVPIGEVTGRLAAATSPPPRAAPPAPATVRVVTWNLDEENDPGTAALAAAIAADPDLAAADVFLFQEEEAYPSEGRSRAAVLAELLGVGYAYVPARPKADGTHGLAIMSRYPIESAMRMDLPATNGQPRIAIAADIALGARVLHVIDLHLETYLNAEERLAQLRPAVLDVLPEVVIAGDFNMGFLQWITTAAPIVSASAAYDQSPAVESYMGALGYDDTSATSGVTSHAFGEEAKLDAVFAHGLDIAFGGVDRVGPSDHWPLWFDVHLP